MRQKAGDEKNTKHSTLRSSDELEVKSLFQVCQCEAKMSLTEAFISILI